MLRISPHLAAVDATPETARALLEETPTLARYLATLSRSSKSKARTRLLEAGYSLDAVNTFLPPVVVQAPRVEGPWTLVPGPIRRAIADAFDVEDTADLSTGADFWNAERAGRAADIVTGMYANPSTVTIALTKLRSTLALIHAAEGLPADVRAATLRPDITREHNRRGEEARAAKAVEGAAIPEPFRRLADLEARVDAFIAGEAATPQTAADLHVVLSARPGEVDTLEIGERGGVPRYVAGVLKKRAIESPEAGYSIVSALGPEKVAAFLEKWRSAPAKDRAAAMKGLPDLLRAWGVPRRGDLRHVGIALAELSASLRGDVHNPATAAAVRLEAARHEAPARRAATAYYEDVGDAQRVQLAARLSQLSPEALAQVLAALALAEQR